MPISLKQDLEKVGGLILEPDGTHCKVKLETCAAREFLCIAIANALLMDRKQLDYGPRNISSFGTFGVIVRMNDKHERLKSLFGKGRRRKAVNESIIDTLRDISNYAIIALMLELGRWPNEDTTR